MTRRAEERLDEARAAKLLAQGLTQVVVAKRLGVSQGAIFHFIQRQKKQQEGATARATTPAE